MEQAHAFHAESEALAALVAPLDEAAFATPTGFKHWSFDSILRHLLVWNRAARQSLADRDAFSAFMAQMGRGVRGGGLPAFEAELLDGLSGQALVTAWIADARATADAFAVADPSARVPWVMGEMSARSSISARLMETWAHGQAIWDALDRERHDDDRIANIARLGVSTYGYTFRNRRLEVPQPQPFVRLVAPSGAEWTFGEPSAEERIEGSATEFCQVVAQTRNIADTGLAVTGPNAAAWMAIAQCFAGPPNDPPPPGARGRGVRAQAAA